MALSIPRSLQLAAGPALVLTLSLACGGGGGGGEQAVAPTVQRLEPATAPVGATVTLVGRGFGRVTEVLVDGHPATISSRLAAANPDPLAQHRTALAQRQAPGQERISFQVPAGATTGAIVLVGPNFRMESQVRLTIAAPEPNPIPNHPTPPGGPTPSGPAPRGPAPSGPAPTWTGPLPPGYAPEEPASPSGSRPTPQQWAARRAEGNSLLAEALHEAAGQARDAALGRDEHWTSTYGTTHRMLDFYTEGNNVALAIAAAPAPAGAIHRVNLHYLSADPYLRYHNVDIHQAVPAEVTDAQWREIYDTLEGVRDFPGQHELQGPFYTAEGTAVPYPDLHRILRKRFKRLFDCARERTTRGEPAIRPEFAGTSTTPLQELAFDISQQFGRCPDGLGDGLTDIETRTMGEGCAHMGEFISQVLADYRMDFIRRHALLGAGQEFRTMTPVFLVQKMLYSMGLRGQFAPLRYAAYPGTDGPLFSPARVMRRFLEGENNVSLGGPTDPRLDFRAYDLEHLIALLQAARERGYVNSSGQPLHAGQVGKRLKWAQIEEEIIEEVDGERQHRDALLGPAYDDFAMNSMDPSFTSAFFELPPAGEPAANIRLTRAFWIHLLRKYGYIVPVS